MCVPRFDGPPVFGRLIGGPAAGEFLLGPAVGGARPRRRYRPGSTVAETVWTVGGATLTLTEGMVAELSGRLLPATLLVRRLEASGGPVRARMRFAPRLGTSRALPRVRRRGPQLVCAWGATAMSLSSSEGAALATDEPVEFTVEPGRPVVFSVSVAVHGPLVYVDPERAWAVLEGEDRWWRSWSDGISDLGPFHQAALRSLITLQLLSYSPSGAPVAAPTTSLPEQLGGERNWDYRYAWPRDASIGIAAFLAAGKVDEARSFFYWLLHATRLDRPRLRPMLTLHGKPVPAERIVSGWPGYAGSRPVRFGNGARDQHQLDVYGWVLDAAWLLNKHGHRLFGETWRALAGATDLVARTWSLPDAGIWEVRGEPRHYVHSKLMAWLALDRALRLTATHPIRASRRQRWEHARSAVAAQIRQQGFDDTGHSYTWAYGSHQLDAALLILPVLEFDDPGSSRLIGTVDAVRRQLSAGGPLLYRYPLEADGLTGREGAFLPCSFWLVQALARTGRLSAATALFERLLLFGGDLGLFAEEVDVDTNEMIGNYPQALTHAALVQAALAIGDATTAQRGPRSSPSAAP